MGNQSSKKDRKDALDSSWSPKERSQLEDNFKHPLSNAPTYFSPHLQACILSFLKDKTKAEYLEFITQCIQTQSGIFNLFQHAVTTHQVSLHTFISWITTTALPLWFSTSGYTWPQDLEENAHVPLVDYFLTNANEQDLQQKESMAWLNEEDTNTTQDTWDEKTRITPSSITQPEFQHWIQRTPIFLRLFQHIILHVFTGKEGKLYQERIDHTSSPQIQHHENETIQLFGQDRFSSLLSPYDYFLITLYLPSHSLSWSDYERQQRQVTNDLQHNLIFSSRRDGMSWQNFVAGLIGRGSTFTVIKTKDNSLFGFYADEAWEAKTEWYGNSSNVLFRLKDRYGGWLGTTANDHYQYLCWGKKTLPNGLGLGGQFDYAGIWIETDFMHGYSRAGPRCTTYASPQLSKKENFSVDEVEGK